VSALRFSRAKDAEIAWLDGELDMGAGRADKGAGSAGEEDEGG